MSITRKDLCFSNFNEGNILALNEFCSNRAEKCGDLNAYITRSKSVLDEAKAVKAQNKEFRKKLLGMPVAVKDNMSTAGQKTTCGSKILENYFPNFDATVVKKIKEHGAIITGKANMDEFAMGSSNENSAYGPVRNPWNKDFVPGGSSGGSAAIVAAGMAAAALGSDTGGSIRQPCGFCGVVGMKPTYGRVSRFGLIAFASSLDQIGPITNTIRDNAIMLEVISGYDPFDSTSKNIPVPEYSSLIDADVAGINVGVPKEYFMDGLNSEIRKSVENSISILKQMGANIVPISLSKLDYAIPAYYVIAPSEASSNLARFDGVKYGYRASEPDNLLDMYRKSRKEGFGREVKRRIMLGTYALSSGYYDAYYLKALKVRNLITQEFLEVFKHVDVIISPVTPSFPFKIGEKTGNPWEMYLSDIYTVSVNLAGLPALAMPCGFSGGFPIGLQLIGKHFNEEVLYRIGNKLEQTLSLDLPFNS